MAIKGKKAYMIYLDEKNAEYVKTFLDKRKDRGGLSAVMDKYVSRLAVLLKENGDLQEGKFTFKVAWNILKKQIKIENEYKNEYKKETN